MKVIANLNDHALVRLTPAGEKRLTDSYGSRVYGGLLQNEPRPDGRHRFMLWELMYLFGPLCTLGSPDQPFFECAIEIVNS